MTHPITRRRFLGMSAGLAAGAVSPFAFAQYPEQAVTIVVAYPPGGQNDAAARIASDALSAQLKKPVIVENKAGASGIIGAQGVSRAAPDGYTLLLVAINHSILTAMKPNLPYNLEKDFTPIGMVAAFPIILVTNLSQPFQNVKELIAYAKANPGKLTYGSSGAGGGTHLAAELFCSLAGVKMTHVPYKGSAPAITDLLGGHINLMFADSPSALPHVKSGKLRALGVSSQTRLSIAPDLPTIAEAGVPGYESNSWVGLAAPAKTPPEIIKTLSADLARAMAEPTVKSRMQGIGGEARSTTAEQFGKFVQAENAKWARIVKERNIPPLD